MRSIWKERFNKAKFLHFTVVNRNTPVQHKLNLMLIKDGLEVQPIQQLLVSHHGQDNTQPEFTFTDKLPRSSAEPS